MIKLTLYLFITTLRLGTIQLAGKACQKQNPSSLVSIFISDKNSFLALKEANNSQIWIEIKNFFQTSYHHSSLKCVSSQEWIKVFFSSCISFYIIISIKDLVNYILVLSINVGKWWIIDVALYFLILTSRTRIFSWFSHRSSKK